MLNRSKDGSTNNADNDSAAIPLLSEEGSLKDGSAPAKPAETPSFLRGGSFFGGNGSFFCSRHPADRAAGATMLGALGGLVGSSTAPFIASALSIPSAAAFFVGCGAGAVTLPACVMLACIPIQDCVNADEADHASQPEAMVFRR